MRQLVDEDLIEPAGDGRRTEFVLTDAGKAYVADHTEEQRKAAMEKIDETRRALYLILAE